MQVYFFTKIDPPDLAFIIMKTKSLYPSFIFICCKRSRQHCLTCKKKCIRKKHRPGFSLRYSTIATLTSELKKTSLQQYCLDSQTFSLDSQSVLFGLPIRHSFKNNTLVLVNIMANNNSLSHDITKSIKLKVFWVSNLIDTVMSMIKLGLDTMTHKNKFWPNNEMPYTGECGLATRALCLASYTIRPSWWEKVGR